LHLCVYKKGHEISETRFQIDKFGHMAYSANKVVQMGSKHRLLILIPAVILIPLFIVMTPLNIARKLSSGEPLVHCKQMRLGNCLYNSLVSQDEHTVAPLDSTRLEQKSTPADGLLIMDIDSIHHNISLDSVPLRC
jgi:hypothetical protein